MNDYKYLKNAYSDNTRHIIKENFYPSSGCPAGKYCPAPKENKLCPEGYYCPSTALLPKVCGNGFYCPENSKKPISCPYGTISAKMSKSIDDCKLEV